MIKICVSNWWYVNICDQNSHQRLTHTNTHTILLDEIVYDSDDEVGCPPWNSQDMRGRVISHQKGLWHRSAYSKCWRWTWMVGPLITSPTTVSDGCIGGIICCSHNHYYYRHDSHHLTYHAAWSIQKNKNSKDMFNNVQPLISVFYSYARLPSCLGALPTPTPTTSPQPSSPWQYRNVFNWDDTSVSWVLDSIGVSCTHEDGYKVQEAFMHKNSEDKEKKKAIFLWLLVQHVAYAIHGIWFNHKHGHVIHCIEPWWSEAILIVFIDAADVAACHTSLVWAFSSCLTWLCSARGCVIVVLLLLVLAPDQLFSVYCEHLLN